MRKITIGNPQVLNTYKSNLSVDYSSGTTVTVLSNVSFSANDLIVIGEPGEELTELQTISSISGKTTINLTVALNFAHPKDTPIYKVLWNFASIEGRSTSSGTFALLTDSPLQWDKLNTVYNHIAGTDTWQYRFRFLNNVTSTYAEYSPTIAGSGFTRYMVGYMIRQVRQITNDIDGRVAGDRAIIRFLNMAQDIIRGTKKDWWFLKVTDSSQQTVTATSKYSVPSAVSDTGNVSDIRYQYNDGTNNIIYPLKYVPITQYDFYTRDQNRTNNDYVQVYTFQEADSTSASGYYLVDPIPLTTGRGTFLVRFYEEIPDLNLITDVTPVPIPSILENFAIAQVEKIKGNEGKSSTYENLFYGRVFLRSRVIETGSGLNLLLKLDAAKKIPAGQPLSLVRFRGQRGLQRFYNNRFISNDYIRENYFAFALLLLPILWLLKFV